VAETGKLIWSRFATRIKNLQGFAGYLPEVRDLRSLTKGSELCVPKFNQAKNVEGEVARLFS